MFVIIGWGSLGLCQTSCKGSFCKEERRDRLAQELVGSDELTWSICSRGLGVPRESAQSSTAWLPAGDSGGCCFIHVSQKHGRNMAYGLVLHPSLTSAYPSVGSFPFASFPSFFPSLCAFAYVWGHGKGVFSRFLVTSQVEEPAVVWAQPYAQIQNSLCAASISNTVRGKYFWTSGPWVYVHWQGTKGSKKITEHYTEVLLFWGFFFTQLHLTWRGRQGPRSLWLNSVGLEVFISLCDSTLGLWVLAVVQRHRTGEM